MTGHYNCGGVKAALQAQELGLIDNWLRNIRDVARLYQVTALGCGLIVLFLLRFHASSRRDACVLQDELMAIRDENARGRRLVELNVLEQAMNVMKIGVVQKRRMETMRDTGVAFPRIHALVYSVEDGILKELDIDHHAEFERYSHIYDLFGAHQTGWNQEDISSMFSFEEEEDGIVGKPASVNADAGCDSVGSGSATVTEFAVNATTILLKDVQLMADLGLDDEEHDHDHDHSHSHSPSTGGL